ncbi:MAG: hypothetical protein ACR2IQ_00795 [Minisyncoccia bacterium]
MKNDWGRYIIVFFITVALFAVAGGLSNFFSNKKVESIRVAQDKLSTDILSSETQFALLSELSCTQDDGEENLSSELGDLSEKIEYSDKNLKGNADALELKRYYSILEIKDYLLTKKVNERCGLKRIPVLYFYTTAENCTECTKQGYVLTELRNKYPNLRVYSFDYSLDLSALRALLKIYHIEDTKLPALVINEHKVTGFQSIEDIEKIEPKIVKIEAQRKASIENKAKAQ